MDEALGPSQGLDAKAPRTLLHIDDSATLRLFVHAAMRRRPHVDVLGAPNGAEGMRLARAHLPALILLDCSLPDIRGIDVLRTLKGAEATSRIPVVVLTGSAGEADQAFAAAGAEQYVVKPIDLDALYALVDRHVPPDEASGTSD